MEKIIEEKQTRPCFRRQTRIQKTILRELCNAMNFRLIAAGNIVREMDTTQRKYSKKIVV
jgi:hypothetical protein